ncbi:MAG: hypothetical protein LUC60_05545 [Lachnospiraceae bacterium]|nr:hypothetical protein [Lachnospiraceae bacterium]
MKKAFEKIQGINGIVLSLYIVVIAAISMFFTLTEFPGMPTVVKLFLLALACVLALAAGPFLVKKLRSFELPPADMDYLHSRRRIWFAVGVWLAAFLIFMLHDIGFYPGAIINDAATQYTQALTGIYNDNHPVLQTFLAFTIPLKLTGGWVPSIVIVQILFFSSVLCYAYTVLCRMVNYKYALGIMAFILLNPFVGQMAVHPIKDTSLAICLTLLIIYTVQVFYLKGKWLDSLVHMVLFAVVLIVSTIIRHNAILFTFPLLVGVCLCLAKKKKQIWKLLIISVALYAGVKGGLYSALTVEEAPEQTVQVVGCPLTIIAHVVAECPESLDDEMKEFVYSIADQETWEKYHMCGNFNNLRRSGEANLNAIEEAGAEGVLRIAIKCVEKEPVESVKALLYLTKVAYSLDPNECFYEVTWTVDEYETVSYQGNQRVMAAMDSYTDLIYNTPLRYIFCYIGMMNLLLVIAICGKIRLNVFDDWKKLFITVSLLTYNFGTMFFLMGSDDRFFFMSFFVAPIYIAFLLRGEAPLLSGSTDESN